MPAGGGVFKSCWNLPRFRLTRSPRITYDDECDYGSSKGNDSPKRVVSVYAAPRGAGFSF